MASNLQKFGLLSRLKKHTQTHHQARLLHAGCQTAAREPEIIALGLCAAPCTLSRRPLDGCALL
jgi:hypothetical protein